MSNYLTTGADLTSIADAIRSKTGGSTNLLYPAGFIAAIESINVDPPQLNVTNATTSLIADTEEDYLMSVPGQKIVTGTFTTQSGAGTNQTISIPYTGSGYPIAAHIYVTNGPYNSNVSTWYNAVKQYAIGAVSIVKSVQTSSPTYTTSGSANQGVYTYTYKSSSSSATTYAANSKMNSNVYTSDVAVEGVCVRFRAADSMSVFIANTSYGLYPNLSYTYHIIYSS